MAYAATNRGHFRQRAGERATTQERQPRAAGAIAPPPGRAIQRLSGRQADGQGRRWSRGGDSGIGRAVAIAFAREGADIAIVYLSEHRGAEETRRAILRENVRCILVAEDTASDSALPSRDQAHHRRIRAPSTSCVNNAAEQQPQADPTGRRAASSANRRCGRICLGMFLPDEGGNAASARRRRDHQHDRGDGLAATAPI